MKVAVLLRGQPRYFEYGASYFNRFIKNSSVDFRIFIHSWDSQSLAMTSQNHSLIEKTSYYALENIGSSTLYDQLVKHWNPSSIQIDSNIEVIKLAKNIIDWNQSNDTHTKKWFFDSVYYDNLFFPVLDAEGINANNRYKYADGVIRLSHFLSQYYSSGESFQVFNKYSQNNDWIPDVVWLTRQDSVVRNGVISNINSVFEFVSMFKGSNLVFVNDMNFNKSREYINDFNFFMPYSSAEKFLGDMKIRLFDIFAKNKLVALSLINSGSLLCHMIWTRLTNNGAEIHKLNPVSRVSPFDRAWEDCIIRPGIEKFSADETTFDSIKKIAHEFVYPRHHAPVSEEEREQVYKLCG